MNVLEQILGKALSTEKAVNTLNGKVSNLQDAIAQIINLSRSSKTPLEISTEPISLTTAKTLEPHKLVCDRLDFITDGDADNITLYFGKPNNQGVKLSIRDHYEFNEVGTVEFWITSTAQSGATLIILSTVGVATALSATPVYPVLSAVTPLFKVSKAINTDWFTANIANASGRPKKYTFQIKCSGATVVKLLVDSGATTDEAAYINNASTITANASFQFDYIAADGESFNIQHETGTINVWATIVISDNVDV